MMELIKNSKIDFVGKRYVAFVISGILSLLGVIAIIQIGLGHANLGVDFAGGTLVEIKFDKPVDMAEIRGILSAKDMADVELQEIGEPGRILIRTRKSDIGNLTTKISDVFKERFGTKNLFRIERTEEVGPKIGAELKGKALGAVFWAIIALMLYITVRFRQPRFGVGAAVATAHDVLAVTGIYWICNREINLLLITALLTLAGYSLTDTVVIFDRIRENLRLRRKEAYEIIVNSSINEVLSRTIVTSLTVLIVLAALLIKGSQITFDFCWILIFGVVIGTYSSIFVASPILIEWDKLMTKKIGVVKKT
ncbi:protein translocase subunit SecF [bacterium]|nr:protein translocase subunit SecF [bacterium]MBU1754457.1 protein translocase subunit SecF [bacterium]